MRRGADHYAKLAGEHTDPSSQLACLILAAYCACEDSGDYGGPTQEMIQLAESILGVSLDGQIPHVPHVPHVMEAVAYVAGEPHSDSPACASPVLRPGVRGF
jgi:hypothetical protein